MDTQRSANLALATLFLGMFVIGSTELLAVGVLDLLAADVGVSIPAAGWLVTAYALGLASAAVIAGLVIRGGRHPGRLGHQLLEAAAGRAGRAPGS